jgi:hypothetical protein
MVFVKPTENSIISLDENYLPYASYNFESNATTPSVLEVTIHLKEPVVYVVKGQDAIGLWKWLNIMIRTQTLEVEPEKLIIDTTISERIRLAKEQAATGTSREVGEEIVFELRK